MSVVSCTPPIFSFDPLSTYTSVYKVGFFFKLKRMMDTIDLYMLMLMWVNLAVIQGLGAERWNPLRRLSHKFSHRFWWKFVICWDLLLLWLLCSFHPRPINTHIYRWFCSEEAVENIGLHQTFTNSFLSNLHCDIHYCSLQFDTKSNGLDLHSRT